MPPPPEARSCSKHHQEQPDAGPSARVTAAALRRIEMASAFVLLRPETFLARFIMKRTTIIFASAVLAFAGAAPVSAQSQGSMKQSSMTGMKMSASDMAMMMSCKRMSKTAMMKNKRCADMMKMHPDMMKMSAADMKKMASCMKMSDKAMKADKRCASMMDMHQKKMMAR
jgi:hypothetical protein